MKVNTVIDRYLFKETVPPFVVSLLLFTAVFLMAKIIDVTDMIISYRVSLWSILLILTYCLPSFLVFVIPMSVMMGILLGFLRLSSDNEIVVMKAGGISLYRLLLPVFTFSLMGLVLTGFMTIYGSPLGRLALKARLLDAAKANVHIGLKGRTFTDGFKDVMLYVNEIDARGKVLRDIFVEDRRTLGVVRTVVAPRGVVVSDPERLDINLKFYNGTISQLSQDAKSVHSVRFDTYDFKLDFSSVLSPSEDRQKGRKELGLAELRQRLREAGENDAEHSLLLMEYHKKFSVPFACLVLGLTAVPLGIQWKSARRFLGVVLGLLFFLVYYSLLSIGWVLGESGLCPPAIGVWAPNLVVGAIGGYLLFMTANEKSVRIITTCIEVFEAPWSRVGRILNRSKWSSHSAKGD